MLEVYLILLSTFDKPRIEHTDLFSSVEIAIIQKYNLYFRYPFTAISLSTTLSFIQLSTFIWVPWLLYNHLWVPAVLIAINYFISALLSRKLNPQYFLRQAVEKKGKEHIRSEMLIVNKVCEKILEMDQKEVETNAADKRNNHKDLDMENEYRIKDIAGEMAKVAFYIDEEAWESIQDIVNEVKLHVDHLKTEYLYLRFFMVEEAVIAFSKDFEMGGLLTEEFYENAALAPEIVAEGLVGVSREEYCLEYENRKLDVAMRFIRLQERDQKLAEEGLVGVSPTEFWLEYEKRKYIYKNISNNIEQLAFSLAEFCGSEELFHNFQIFHFQILPLCIRCVAVGVAVREDLKSKIY